MIWYRHWIEMRGGICVAAGCMILACLLFAVIVGGSTGWYAQSGRIIHEFDLLVPHLNVMGPARFLVWSAHTFASAGAAILIGIFLAGTGIRTNGFQSPLSMYYTLTLPISRFELVWTRFASAFAAVYALFAAMLVVDCAILAVMRQPIPLAPMAVSSLLAGLIVVPSMAVFGVLLSMWKDPAAGALYFVAIAATFKFAWPTLLRFAGSLEIPWLWIGAVLLVTGAALSSAFVLARRLEF